MRIADFEELRTKLARQKALVAASIEITLRCNEDCIHCLRNLENDDGLALAVVCDVLDQLAEMGCIKVTFTGGEPFVRRDFLEIVRYAWKKRFSITILTNGTLLTPGMAAELKTLHVAELQFSLYAADPDVHDSVTTIPGSYSRTLRGIRYAKEQGLNIRIAMPVLSVNADQVSAVEEICQELGATFTRGPLIFPKNNGDVEPLDVLATDVQVEALAMASHRKIPSKAPSCATLPTGGPLCSAGRDHIGIGPDGAIYPCDALRLSIGNVHHDRIADVWVNSAPLLGFRAVRRKHPPECWGCSAREQCMWCPGLSRQLMGNSALPNPQDCRRTRVNLARLEADDLGWTVPAHLQTKVPVTTGGCSRCYGSVNEASSKFIPLSSLLN